MIQMLDGFGPTVLALKLSGRLHDEDYDRFVPMVDDAVTKHGKVRMFVEFEDFHGWSLHALWDDIVFAASHCEEIERIALVGEKTWQEWMAKVCKPFTGADVRYFDRADIAAARMWIDEAV
jgi:hypothetical protein